MGMLKGVKNSTADMFWEETNHRIFVSSCTYGISTVKSCIASEFLKLFFGQDWREEALLRKSRLNNDHENIYKKGKGRKHLFVQIKQEENQ